MKKIISSKGESKISIKILNCFVYLHPKGWLKMLEIIATLLLTYLFLKLVGRIFPCDGTLFDRWFHHHKNG